MAERMKEYTPDKEGYEQSLEDLEEIEPKQAKESSFSKGIVVLMFITIIAFVQECMFFYWNGKTVDPTLIAGFFLCFGFEFGSLVAVKRGKLKYVAGKFGDKQLGHVEAIEETEEEDGNRRAGQENE